jgi:hypothetical protein
MSVTISTLSHYVRAELKAQSPSAPSLGHVHQLLAASFGYKSLASHGTAVAAGTEIAELEEARFFVPDSDMFQARAESLGLGGMAEDIANAIEMARQRTWRRTKLVGEVDDVFDTIRGEVDFAITDSSEFSGVQAETGGGPAELELEFLPTEEFAEAGPTWVVEATGLAFLDNDDERPAAGDKIDVNSHVVFRKVGRRLLGPFDVEAIEARVVGWE